MPILYPVKASAAPDAFGFGQPGFGVFDRTGMWACRAPSGAMAFSDLTTAQIVAGAINQAFADGKAEARWAMRDALGIEDEERYS